MLLCCRDSTGIIEDIQNSIDEIKLENNVRIVQKIYRYHFSVHRNNTTTNDHLIIDLNLQIN